MSWPGSVPDPIIPTPRDLLALVARLSCLHWDILDNQSAHPGLLQRGHKALGPVSLSFFTNLTHIDCREDTQGDLSLLHHQYDCRGLVGQSVISWHRLLIYTGTC